MSPLEHCRAASQLANPAPQIYEQCISRERRSNSAGAVSCKENAAPGALSGVLLIRTPLQVKRAESHHSNAGRNVWSGENLTDSLLQVSGAASLRQNTAPEGWSGVIVLVFDRHPSFLKWRRSLQSCVNYVWAASRNTTTSLNVCFFEKSSKRASKARGIAAPSTFTGVDYQPGLPTGILRSRLKERCRSRNALKSTACLRRTPLVTARMAATRTCLCARGDAANGASERGWCLARVSARAGGRSIMLCS